MKKQRRRRRFRKWLIFPLLILLYVLAANGIHPLNDIPLPSFGSEVRTTANEDHGWNLILVNRDHLIPDHYETELTELSNGRRWIPVFIPISRTCLTRPDPRATACSLPPGTGRRKSSSSCWMKKQKPTKRKATPGQRPDGWQNSGSPSREQASISWGSP